MGSFTSPPSQRRSFSAISALLGSLLLSTLWIPTTWAQVPKKSSADYFIHRLPGQPDGPLLKMHAGHIEVSAENNGHLFFWHFQNRHIADSQKTVIWLNGGPGCSSMDGALMEIGPYRVGPGGKLRYNNGSWDEFANVLFVDNPVGTGFSYVDTNSYVHELPEMAEQFITFLESWFSIFPEYSHDEIYLAGESYAGQHIPYIAKAILDRNKVSQEPWKLSGLLIGNGWIAPGQQYYAYLQYAYKSGLIQGGTDKAKKVEAQQAICQKILETTGQDAVEIPECEEVLQVILRLTNDRSSNQGCVNMYDIRLRDSYPSCGMNWPPDLDHVTPYLRREDVIQALHVDPAKRSGWTECNGAVGSNFRARNSKPSVELLPDLLAELPIILFSGDKDMICNHIGTEELINNLKWNGGVGFERSPGTWAPRQDWTFEEEPAGFYQEARNLTYIVFYNSSHMVPFDYPRRTRDMLDRFIGIDIGDIGGEPADSRIGGEKGPLTSVGSHPNSTAAEEAEEQKLKDATWHAYYKSGEVALVVVAIAAGLWGFFVWRDRRRRRAGYTSLFGGNPHDSRPGSSRGGAGLEGFRNKRHGRDIEAADFDENELDEVSSSESLRKQSDKDREMERERYSLGEDSDDEEVGGSREKLTGGQPR